jgi:hypothetical protein
MQSRIVSFLHYKLIFLKLILRFKIFIRNIFINFLSHIFEYTNNKDLSYPGLDPLTFLFIIQLFNR